MIRTLIGFLAVTLVLLSCKKEFSDEDGKIPDIIESTWQFKENGQEFRGDMDSAFYQSTAGFTALTMTGSSTEPAGGEIILQITGSDIAKGSYSTSQIFFQYAQNGSVVYQTIPGQTGDFTITIDAIDSNEVSGTFSGTAYDASSGTHQIVEGKFTAAMAGATVQPPPQTAQLTVWAKEICFDGSSIEIQVAGQTGFITDAMDTEPECSAASTATFVLQTGSYEVTAICGADTLKYNVDVNSTCVKLQIDFAHPPILEDYLPLTQGSSWDYVDLGNPAATQHAVSVGDTSIDGRQYTMVINSLPDTFYYRKSGNVYYEYITLDFNGYVQDPPSFEMEILRDNLQAGDTWETPPIDLNLSGVSVKAKLVSTIVDRDFSATIAGTIYDNLILVNTKILFSSDGGVTYVESGSEYNQIYSRGNGIVYYLDLENNIEWGATSISITP